MNQQIISIVKNICEGLKFLHNNNIIHLDLNSKNILLDKKNDIITACITDFGLSMRKGIKRNHTLKNVKLMHPSTYFYNKDGIITNNPIKFDVKYDMGFYSIII